MRQITAWVLATTVIIAHNGLAQVTDSSTKNLPYVDYQWVVSTDVCSERGLYTLRKNGFKILDKKDLVGVKNGYKGIVACIDNDSDMTDVAVFIVVGPDQERTKSLAIKMKDSFSDER